MHTWCTAAHLNTNVKKLKTDKHINEYIVTKEYSVKMDLHKRRKHKCALCRILSSWMLNPLCISDDILFRNNFTDNKCILFKKKIFSHPRESFL